VFDKSSRGDGTFSREDFAYDQQSDVYVCPAGKVLASTGTVVNDGTTRSIAPANMTATPANSSSVVARRCPPARSHAIYENARDVARDIAKTEAYVTSRRERKKIEMPFAHLKRILRVNRRSNLTPHRRPILTPLNGGF
jgi:hypothetical protein